MWQNPDNHKAGPVVFRRGTAFRILAAVFVMLLCLSLYHKEVVYDSTSQLLSKCSGRNEQDLRASIEQQLRSSIEQEMRAKFGEELQASLAGKRPNTCISPPQITTLHGDSVVEEEVMLPGKVKRYTRFIEGAESELLWFVMTYNNESWSKLPDGSMRNIKDLHDLTLGQYRLQNSSLALLTSSRDEYEQYKKSVADMPYARVTIFLHPGYFGTGVTRGNRHDQDKQLRRRSEMAKMRNYLMLKAFKEEKHTVWLDADVWRIDPGLVRKVMQHVDRQKEYGIFTVLCKTGNAGNYDRNAWAGSRQGPRGWDLTPEEIANGEEAKQGRHLVTELIKNTKGNDIIPLDNVGGTFLYMRGDLIPQGLNFPHQYAIGTRWGKDGYDGIETEGICYRARGLGGGRCGVLGGQWHVSHSWF